MGAGMLALPVATGLCGFKFSVLILIASFAYMLLTLFYLLEANLVSNKVSANIITMVKDHFGPVMQGVAWVTFLLLLYAVASAYISGGGAILGRVLSSSLAIDLPSWAGVTVFFVFFGLLVVFGTDVVDSVNRVCMVALIVSFVFLCITLASHMEPSLYTGGQVKYIYAAIPVMVLSFTSHLILPSLRTYLLGDVAKLKKALIYGSLIPLAVYFLWQLLVFGVLPADQAGLGIIAESKDPVTALAAELSYRAGDAWIGAVVSFFSFFALITSFFGVSLSLFDFLADGFHIKKDVKGKVLLLILMYTPPVIFSLFYSQGFIMALGYAGVFVAILYGIFPPIIVYKTRYIEKKKEAFSVWGGRPLIIFTLIGAVAIITLQVLHTQGLLPS